MIHKKHILTQRRKGRKGNQANSVRKKTFNALILLFTLKLLIFFAGFAPLRETAFYDFES
jgi:hypothetical protein